MCSSKLLKWYALRGGSLRREAGTRSKFVREDIVAEKQIIAVLGATGAQGGVVRAILNDPNGGFTARALPARRRQLPC
jgi:hypothetical protein